MKALAKIKEIKTDEDRALADKLIKDGRLIRKTIETKRFELSTPLEDQKKKLIAYEREFAGPLDTEVLRLTGLVNAHIKEQYRVAEEARKQLADEEETRLKRLRSSASIAKVQTEFEEKRAEVVAPAAGVRMDTKYEVIDLNQVPRELLMLDPDKVKALLKPGPNIAPAFDLPGNPAVRGVDLL